LFFFSQNLLADVDLPHIQTIQVPVSGSDQKAQVKLYLPPGNIVIKEIDNKTGK